MLSFTLNISVQSLDHYFSISFSGHSEVGISFAIHYIVNSRVQFALLEYIRVANCTVDSYLNEID